MASRSTYAHRFTIDIPHPPCTFLFVLPRGLPSSFDSDSHNPGGTISYVIKVVTNRQRLHPEKKLAK
jgi:hypothetical protein